MNENIKLKIFKRDNFTCQYCGWNAKVDFKHWFVAMLSIDHIKADILGGTDNETNLVTSCHACNVYKGKQKCESLEEAKIFVSQKRNEALNWYNKYVKNI